MVINFTFQLNPWEVLPIAIAPAVGLAVALAEPLAVPLAVPIAGTLSLSGVLGRRGSIGVFLLPYEMLLFM